MKSNKRESSEDGTIGYFLDILGDNPTSRAKSTLRAIQDLVESLPEYIAYPNTGMATGEEIKYLTWTFETSEFDQIEILHLTDTQFGQLKCNVKKLVEYRDWVLSVPNRFVVFGGDMIDAATVASPGEPWDNFCSPQRQVYKFCELLAPMRHRILGYVGGNHEARSMRFFGNLGILISSLLQIPYSSGQQFVNIVYGKHKPFKVFLWHGSGSARTAGARMQKLYYAMKELSGNAHATLLGHYHDAMIKASTWRDHDYEKNRVVDKKIFGAISSSFLDYFGTYAEAAGLSPSSLIMARIILGPDGHWELTIR